MSALVFDCDGVLADTERDGHRVAFNQLFAERGLPVSWSEDEYGRKLQIAGGKERMASVLTPEFCAANDLPTDPDGQAALLADWHRRKTAIYTEMVAAGRLPTRPGHPPHHRRGAGCGLGPGRRLDVGRAVGARHPRPGSGAGARGALRRRSRRRRRRRQEAAPDIYLLALERLGAPTSDVLVMEDSRNGILAAAGAGLRSVMTVNGYTEEEANDEAILVVSSLGDPDGERTRVIANRSAADPGAFVTLDDLQRCLAA